MARVLGDLDLTKVPGFYVLVWSAEEAAELAQFSSPAKRLFAVCSQWSTFPQCFDWQFETYADHRHLSSMSEELKFDPADFVVKRRGNPPSLGGGRFTVPVGLGQGQ